MSRNPFIEMSNSNKGLFQLVGTPRSNYNKLLYGKALLACHENQTVYFFDNKKLIEKETLINDLLGNENLLSSFFIFRPKNQLEFFQTVDDLDLLYLKNNEKNTFTIFVSNIFEFIINDARNSRKTELLLYTLGLLKILTQQYNIAVFSTNETRKQNSSDYPFLSYTFSPFFDKVYMLDFLKGKEIIKEYVIE